MKNRMQTGRRGDCLVPTDPRLLASPLDFIAEDHLRQRVICAMLDRIASGDAGPEDLQQVRQVLGHELPLHLQDEEEDLFPLMRRRCEPEDEIDKVIERLRNEHAHGAEETRNVITVVEMSGAGAKRLSKAHRAMLTAYATRTRRRLIVVNAIILPLARLRLTMDDLETLRLRMQARRGLDAET